MKQDRSGTPFRRFHRWSGDPYGRLRPWEKQLWALLYDGSPERRLWASVLAEALQELYAGTQVETARETITWIREMRQDHLGAFSCVCTNLDLDMDEVRLSVLQDIPMFPIVICQCAVEDLDVHEDPVCPLYGEAK